MAVSFKEDNWSSWQYPQYESHTKYLYSFNYQQLKRAEFEKLLSWYALDQKEDSMNRKIRKYLINNHRPDKDKMDSLKIMILKRRVKSGEIRNDTLKEACYPTD